MNLVPLLLLTLAQTVPHTEVTSLNGQALSFPRPGSEKPLLIVLSFSHKGGDDVSNWYKYVKEDPRLDYYELADFQGVPSLIMKMILHGMRRSVKEPERSHLAPFYSNEDQWKQLAHFEDPAVAYVLLAKAKGEVIWQTRGPATDAGAADLKAALKKLLAK
jgi:hypothetical protein